MTANLDEYAAAIIQISKQIEDKRKLLKKIGKPLDGEVKFKSKLIISINFFLGFIIFPLTIIAAMISYREPLSPHDGQGIAIALYFIYVIFALNSISSLKYIRAESVWLACVYLAPLSAYGNFLKLDMFWYWEDFAVLVIPPLLLSLGALININLMDKAFVEEADPTVLIQSLTNNDSMNSADLNTILYRAEELLFLNLISLNDSRILSHDRKNKRLLLILISLAIMEGERFLDYIIDGGDPESLKELKKDGYIEAIFRNRNADERGEFSRFNEAIEKLQLP